MTTSQISPQDELEERTDLTNLLPDPRNARAHSKRNLDLIAQPLIAELLCEPFAGSGTTFVAAERRGQVCYGLELSPAYCDVIVARWEQLTGH